VGLIWASAMASSCVMAANLAEVALLSIAGMADPRGGHGGRGD